MGNKIFAPTIARIEQVYRLRFGEYASVTRETKDMISALLERLALLKAERENELWRFWIYAPRGPIEAFGDYKELHEYEEYASYEEFEQAWRENYSKDTYWYEITVSHYNEYFALSINNSLVVSLAPNQGNEWNVCDLADFLAFVIEHLDKIIAGLQEGTYNQWLASALPYQYRLGVIPRKKLWEIEDRYKKWSLHDLSEQEIAEYIGYSNQEALDGKTTIRIQKMTTQKYFDICAICYLAAKYEGAEKMSAEQMYLRFADDRDGGLRTFDYNSAEAFDRWYSLSADEKWEIDNPSHLWELREGSSYSRIHLFVKKDEGGYYLSLSGGTEPCTDELVRMYCALKRNGIPLVFPAREAIAKKLLGEDMVGIVPCTDWGWTYSYGSFPQEDVISFIPFHSENILPENEQTLICSTEWFPLRSLSLKKI